MSHKYTDGVPEGLATTTPVIMAAGAVQAGIISILSILAWRNPSRKKFNRLGLAAVACVCIVLLIEHFGIGERSFWPFVLVFLAWSLVFGTVVAWISYHFHKDEGEKAEVWEARMAAQRQRDESRPQI